MEQEEIRMTYSGIIENKGKRGVRVMFERGRNDYAEGLVPEGRITKSSGFSQEEIRQLSEYLLHNTNNILERARLINPLRGFLEK